MTAVRCRLRFFRFFFAEKEGGAVGRILELDLGRFSLSFIFVTE